MMIQGDCLTILRDRFADESVNCCVTSPPYWGLRDYGVDGQLGLEKTPEEYVAKMVEVFREVRRVLKADGTLWLNLGDSYWGSGKGLNKDGTHSSENKPTDKQFTNSGSLKTKVSKYPDNCGLKEKDLVGIPWRVALALQADGWYLRSDIIWAKPNPMPESVMDRPTKAHEYLFLMSKSEKYFCDMDAIKERGIDEPGTHRGGSLLKAAAGVKGDPNVQWHNHGGGIESLLATGYRNKRSVWTVATRPYSDAHFATFPPKLIEPCILAGCPTGGLVLDPFAGSGTTVMVAKQLNRKAVGIELNPAYIEMAEQRLLQESLPL